MSLKSEPERRRFALSVDTLSFASLDFRDQLDPDRRRDDGDVGVMIVSLNSEARRPLRSVDLGGMEGTVETSEDALPVLVTLMFGRPKSSSVAGNTDSEDTDLFIPGLDLRRICRGLISQRVSLSSEVASLSVGLVGVDET